MSLALSRQCKIVNSHRQAPSLIMEDIRPGNYNQRCTVNDEMHRDPFQFCSCWKSITTGTIFGEDLPILIRSGAGLPNCLYNRSCTTVLHKSQIAFKSGNGCFQSIGQMTMTDQAQIYSCICYFCDMVDPNVRLLIGCGILDRHQLVSDIFGLCCLEKSVKIDNVNYV